MPKKKSSTSNLLTKEYVQILSNIKKRIKAAQVKAAFSVNEELIKLYWSIGKTVVEKQKSYGWGSHFLEQLSKDLQNSFPGTGGFSRTNISRMRSFYQYYEKCAQAVPKFEDLPIFRIPWGHNILILQKNETEKERLWYAEKALEFGWSRQTLEDSIKTKLYDREGSAVTNFKTTLPLPHSEMAHQTLKDPYILDNLAS